MAREREKIITSDDVMAYTDAGRDVFEREVGRIAHKNIKSPLRDDGAIPSFQIKKSSTSGIWIFVDHGGTNETGNCITFISLLYNISYSEAIEKIAKDFGFGNKDVVIQRKIIVPTVKVPDIWEYSVKKFQDNHKIYMDQYELDESFLNGHDVFALDSFAINKKVQTLANNTHSFVYVHKDSNGKETGGIKMLRLGNIDKRFKWRTNVPNSALWYTYLIPKDCETVFINKSVKDALSLIKHCSIPSIATQNESAILLLDNNYEYINNLAKNKVMCFGSDFQGHHESLIITYVTDWLYFNTPNHVLNKYEIEDVSDYIAKYGVNSLRVLLKNKKFI